MTDEGMVELRPDETDMRIKKVYLTEYGRQTDRDGIKRIQSMDATGLRNISDDERKTLMSLLCKIRENLLDEKISENTDE